MKGQPETNILAYYKHSQITAVKRFIVLGPGVNISKPFITVNDSRKNGARVFYGATTFSKMTLGIMTLGIKILGVMLYLQHSE